MRGQGAAYTSDPRNYSGPAKPWLRGEMPRMTPVNSTFDKMGSAAIRRVASLADAGALRPEPIQPVK